MENIEEGYIKLFEIARTDYEKARRIGSLIDKEDLDPLSLLEMHEERNKNTRLLSSELALSVHPKNLQYKSIFEYLEAADMGIVLLATKLINSIDIDDFELKFLIEMQRSRCVEQRNLAKEIALRMNIKNLDFDVLKDYLHDTDNMVKALAALLLMIHYQERLDYVEIIEFQEIPLPDVRELSANISILIPPKKLKALVLIDLQKSKNHSVRALSFLMAEKIYSSCLTLDLLFEAAKTYDENVAKLVFFLANKISVKQINYVICLKHQASTFSNVRVLARMLAIKAHSIYMNFDVLVDFSKSRDLPTRALAVILLLTHHPRKITLEMFESYDDIKDSCVERMIEEKKKVYWSFHGEDAIEEESFVKTYF